MLWWGGGCGVGLVRGVVRDVVMGLVGAVTLRSTFAEQ